MPPQSTQSGNSGPISGVHSIIMEKSALAGWDARPPTPFHSISIMYKVPVNAPSERAGTLPLFYLYHYMHSADATVMAEATLN
jgi:hypothetical protein